MSVGLGLLLAGWAMLVAGSVWVSGAWGLVGSGLATILLGLVVDWERVR